MKLNAFLPCKPYSEKGNDIDRVIKVLVPSFNFAISKNFTSVEITIAVPDGQYSDVLNHFSRLWERSSKNGFNTNPNSTAGTTIYLVEESTICPKPEGINPWVYQQLLKLSYCGKSHNQFKYVLILDSDVLCTRPIHYHELFFINRARLGNLSKRAFNGQNHWWKSSAQILDVDVNNMFASTGKVNTEEGYIKPRIGITPVLST